MRNRLSLVDSAKSSKLTRISGDMLTMLMVSLASTVLPAFKAFTGLRTNGSALVPAPERNAGSEVVFSGSGPIKMTLSRNKRANNSNANSRIKQNGMRHIKNPLPSSLSSSAYLPSMQSPSSSTFGTLVWSTGSLPHLISISSRWPSLSSSGSVSRPVSDGSSGNWSPSVSLRTPKPKVKLMFTRPLSAVTV